jgi:sugar lactone lactonase YvrE
MVRHADLGSLADGWNEIVVDGRGNIYVNAVGIRFADADMSVFDPGGEAFSAGIIALVTPDGSVRQVADGIAFPNGMVVTPDNSTLVISESFARRLTAFDIAGDGSLSNRRVWADGVGPDGICIDAEGVVWTQTGGQGCARVRDGGDMLEQVELDRSPFACMLGGPDGRTLFITTADWRMEEGPSDNIARLTTGPRTGRLLTAPAPAPRAGWP